MVLQLYQVQVLAMFQANLKKGMERVGKNYILFDKQNKNKTYLLIETKLKLITRVDQSLRASIFMNNASLASSTLKNKELVISMRSMQKFKMKMPSMQ